MQEYFENYRENERVYCGDKGLTFVKFKPIGWPLGGCLNWGLPNIGGVLLTHVGAFVGHAPFV